VVGSVLVDLIDVVLVVVGVLDSLLVAVMAPVLVIHFVFAFSLIVPAILVLGILMTIHHLFITVVALTILLGAGCDLVCILFKQQCYGSSEQLKRNILLTLCFTTSLQEFLELLIGGLAVLIHHLLKQDLERL